MSFERSSMRPIGPGSNLDRCLRGQLGTELAGGASFLVATRFRRASDGRSDPHQSFHAGINLTLVPAVVQFCLCMIKLDGKARPHYQWIKFQPAARFRCRPFKLTNCLAFTLIQYN